jgi:hypothetical protein
MSPNSLHAPSRTHIPYSVIPVLPITEQIRTVQLAIAKLKKRSVTIQNTFLENLSKVKENNLTKIFSACKPIGRNLWKFHNLCFMYRPKMTNHDLFMEKKGLSLLTIIKNTLLLKTIEWVCLIQQEATFIFQLSSKGYLLWSPVLKEIVPYFIASILFDNTILDSIDDSWRWKSLDKIKTHILNFINSGIEGNTLNTENNELFVSRVFFLIDTFLKVKENFIEYINKEFNLITSSYYDFTQISNQIQQILNQHQKTDYDLILEPLEASKFKKNCSSNPSTDYYWILDFSPLTILEIIPHMKNLGDNQKFGEFYTPLALAETIVIRAFGSLLDQGLKKPITDLRVLDPAMGTGILLVFAIEWLVNLTLSYTTGNSFIELRRKFAYSNFKGVDIDEDGILIYQKFLRSFYLLEKEIEGRKFCLDQIDFIDSFITCSKLKQPLPKFDVILSNPPYLAFHSRFTKNLSLKVELQSLRELIPVFCGKRDNTYLLFLGICLQHFLVPEGVVGFVIDHSFMDLPSYEKIRKSLLTNYHVSYILSNYNYRKTAVVDLALLVIRNTYSSLPTLWQETLEEETRKVSKDHFLSQPNCSYLYHEGFSSLARFNDYTIPLGDIASISCGLEYGALLKTNFLSSKGSKGFHKCIDGSNGLFYPFFLFWVPGQHNSYVRFDKEYEKRLQDENKNISRTKKKVILISGKKDRFLTDKIILRQTAPRFIATLDTQKFLTLRNTHLIYNPKPPYSLYFILGILCSSLGNYIGERFNIIRKPRKGSSRYPQIRLNDLKKFPIVDINQINDTSIINQVEIAVKKCLNIGESITDVLTNLWDILLETGSEYMSQRQFLKMFLKRNHLTLSEKKEIESIKQSKISILEDLTKLAIQRDEIDSLIFRLYKISPQDQKKINSELKE